MRLLILGAAGVLGSATAREAIRKDHEVHVLLRPSAEAARLSDCEGMLAQHRIDLEDSAGVQELLTGLRPHAIVHAAFSRGHPQSAAAREDMLKRGLGASFGLLEALRAAKFDGALVYLGSMASYGPAPEPHHPTHLLQPTSFRGMVKAAESLMFGQFARESQRIVTELRVSSAYGPWQHRTGILSHLVAAALMDKRVQLTKQPVFRDWVYMEDVADACLHACRCDTPGGRIFNVCSGTLTSTHAAAQVLEKLTGRRLIGDGFYSGMDDYGDSQPVGALPRPEDGFPWRPTHDLQSGLEAYWSWATSRTGRSYLLQDRS